MALYKSIYYKKKNLILLDDNPTSNIDCKQESPLSVCLSFFVVVLGHRVILYFTTFCPGTRVIFFLIQYVYRRQRKKKPKPAYSYILFYSLIFVLFTILLLYSVHNGNRSAMSLNGVHHVENVYPYRYNVPGTYTCLKFKISLIFINTISTCLHYIIIIIRNTTCRK